MKKYIVTETQIQNIVDKMVNEQNQIKKCTTPVTTVKKKK